MPADASPISDWEETSGQTRNPLEGVYIQSGLGTPGCPSGRPAVDMWLRTRTPRLARYSFYHHDRDPDKQRQQRTNEQIITFIINIISFVQLLFSIHAMHHFIFTFHFATVEAEQEINKRLVKQFYFGVSMKASKLKCRVK